MPWDTARSIAASAVLSKCGGAFCTRGCGRAGQVVVGGADLPVCGDFQRRRQHSATTVQRALPVRVWVALGMSLVTARSNETSAVCSRCAGGCTWGCGRARQVIFGGAVSPALCGDFHSRRQHSATSAHRALPLFEGPALILPRGTARSSAASAAV